VGKGGGGWGKRIPTQREKTNCQVETGRQFLKKGKGEKGGGKPRAYKEGDDQKRVRVDKDWISRDA